MRCSSLNLLALSCLSSLPIFAQAQSTSPPKLCKTTPSSPSWPNISTWDALNTTLCGKLLQPLPPASACHSSYRTYNISTCTNINNSWSDFTFHQNNPISTAWNNMNNDSCLPFPSAPCSGLGYPVYVVNATSAQDVKAAIDFARERGIRVTVKASGHDYLKRSVAPNSLLIWTRYMTGNFTFHDTFTPKGCNITIPTTAVTAGAGSYVSQLYSTLDALNQTLVDGMGKEVTLGGYLTGGGHSPISHIYGLGSDQVYEAEIVTPMGEILTANECLNSDLFWAVRGGGGSTFGVLTKITVRTVPATPMAVFDFKLEAAPNSTAYWEAVAYLLAQFPIISAANVSAFTYLTPTAASFEAVFVLPDPQSSAALQELIAPFWKHVNETFGNQLNSSATSTIFPNLYSTFLVYADASEAGVDKVVGSWLLPPDTLTNVTFLDALKKFLGTAGGRLYMVSGKGVWDAEPRGGSDAVNPAWRKALIHAVTSQNWTPLHETARAIVEHELNHVQTQALRRLVPESGAYLNEAYWDEPNFQHAFWGSNYERLLQIKKEIDPDDVFWCRTCVGSEGWKEVGNNLCRI